MKKSIFTLASVLTVLFTFGCGGGGGSGSGALSNEVSDSTDPGGYHAPVPCGTFGVSAVANTPGVYQCTSTVNGEANIVMYCSIKSECTQACAEEAASCGQ